MVRPLARIALPIALALLLAPAANADLILGTISDFDDGTTQGWDPPKANTSNAGGFLQVSPAPRLAAFNADANASGSLHPAVTAIRADLMRPAGQTDLEIRLVLFGPTANDRWTSTLAEMVLGDGAWRRYEFSVLEADLTRVLGTSTYAELSGSLDRIMFRLDDGVPDAEGSLTAGGTFGIDNVVAVPEPATAMLLLTGLGALAFRRSG